MPSYMDLEATRQLRKMDTVIPHTGLTANAIPQQLEECKKQKWMITTKTH